MIGRIGPDIHHPALERCQGCGDATLMCEVEMEQKATRCCGCCTHLHDLATLALYGLLEA